MRRSDDDGLTWDSPRVLVTGAMLKLPYAATVGNPTSVFDKSTGTIWMLFCTNHADDAEWQIHARQGIDSRRVWVTSSPDMGCVR